MVALEPGSTFAGYRIERRLGTGGMGAVYLAKHPRLPRRDALKILDAGLGADKSFRARFEREAELTSRLDHQNIVSIHDRGLEGDRLWISMQFVDGVDASQLIEQGPSALPFARSVHIAAEAAKGLDFAHRNGLLHRDVKPANLLISTDEDTDKVFVTDFGIARSLDDTTALTSTGSFLATIAYAAPELIEGRSIDHRIDVYALGCTLFEMLTGSVPFVRANPVAMMHAHVTAPAPHPSEYNRAMPPAFDAVIARAMAKDPADRFQSCRELGAAAAAALSGRTAPTVIRQVPTDPNSQHRISTPQPTPPPTAVAPQRRPISQPTYVQPQQPLSSPHHSVPHNNPPHNVPPHNVPPRPFVGPPGPTGPPGPSRPAQGRGNGRIIAAVVAVLALLVVVGIVGAVIANDNDSGGGTPTTEAATDAEQIEAAIRAAYQKVDDDGFAASIMSFCTDARTRYQEQIDNGDFVDEPDADTYEITVDGIENIEIDGPTATADVTTTISGLGADDGTSTDVENLTRENGRWKVCPVN